MSWIGDIGICLGVTGNWIDVVSIRVRVNNLLLLVLILLLSLLRLSLLLLLCFFSLGQFDVNINEFIDYFDFGLERCA